MALALVAAVAAPWQSVPATSASPHPFTVEQPDGSRVVLHVRGNPAFNWQEDINGFTVLEQSGRYVYARRGASGRLEATDHEVGKVDPRAVGLNWRTLPSAAVRAALRAGGPAGEESAPAAAPEASLTQGTLKNLVVLIRFADHTTRTLPTVPALARHFSGSSAKCFTL